ncbi:hypothetical protein M9H77_12503 [Catharanthus roseus]|uniref:Uncharacterized protein n=1 Tax=Catharanthus roseus TaxID=4058 RepID=A0ACC0BHI6_CATRO|nr:hypothetical protein M9H77_12503 [Catharanthus roseus]
MFSRLSSSSFSIQPLKSSGKIKILFVRQLVAICCFISSTIGIRAWKRLQLSGALQRYQRPLGKIPDLRELLSSLELASKLVTPSSSIPDPSSVPETLVPELEDSDEEEEHPKAQAQALRDYLLSRERVRRAHKEPSRYGYSYILLYDDPMGLNRR